MKQTVKIDGMNCDHCVGKIEKAVSNLEGVEKIKVKLKNAEAKIKYDESKIELDKVLAVINELGYEASSI